MRKPQRRRPPQPHVSAPRHRGVAGSSLMAQTGNRACTCRPGSERWRCRTQNTRRGWDRRLLHTPCATGGNAAGDPSRPWPAADGSRFFSHGGGQTRPHQGAGGCGSRSVVHLLTHGIVVPWADACHPRTRFSRNAPTPRRHPALPPSQPWRWWDVHARSGEAARAHAGFQRHLPLRESRSSRAVPS